jgi:hypothetical protein
MDENLYNLPPRKTLWMYFREGLRKANANRPVSFYLLLAIPVGLLLGSQIATMRDTPKRFGFFLGLLFIFFLAILWGAVIDFFDIARRHLAESRNVFRTTLGDAEFLAKLNAHAEEEREKMT